MSGWSNGSGVDKEWTKSGPWRAMSDDEFIAAYLAALKQGKQGGIHVLNRLKQITRRRKEQT